MKTIKVKVVPAYNTDKNIKPYQEQLTWLWNKCRWISLTNHCIEWYKWASKNKVNLEGCLKTPLLFSKVGAWNYASCRIATGGCYWKADKSAPLINYRLTKNGKPIKKDGKDVKRTRYGYKKFEGEKPWLHVKPVGFYYPELTFLNNKGRKNQKLETRQLKNISNLNNLGILNKLREQDNLTNLTIHTDFIGGLIDDFDVAWKAYLDPKLTNRKKPKFKDERNPVSTLNNSQSPCECLHVFICHDLKFKAIDKNWRKRLGNLVARTYKIVIKPSGYYICISAATLGESQRPSLSAKLDKLRKVIKKDAGKNKADQDKALAESPEYQQQKKNLDLLNERIKLENLTLSSCNKKSGKTAGVDPGVKAIVTTDHGALFNPNISRQRISIHIKELQHKLDIMRDRNDKKTGLCWKSKKRAATKNEDKLQRQIIRLHERGANSSNMFNHKLSVRLARTYDAIGWEDTKITNMNKSVDPKLSEDGSKYEKNKAKSKSGLNRSLSLTCMGDLRSKARDQMEKANKKLVDSVAKNSSKKCHCCGIIGDRSEQEIFQCLNSSCELHLMIQNADINAAKNHKASLFNN